MEILKKLDSSIKDAIKLINESAEQKQVIFLRHHNDCDGYSAALALDKIVHKVVSDNHFKERDAFYYYRRIPCQAPFYTFEDSTRDISYIYDTMVSRNKSPLMIVVDNGSSKEDYDGLMRLKTFGFKIIVIDHHPVYDKINDVVDVHINPHLVEKGPVIGAGALCSHIAMAADKDNQEYFDFISCVSSISDHMQGPLFDDSFKRIKDKFSLDDLRGFGEAVDYELQRSGFLDPWTFIKEILADELGLRSKLMPEYKASIVSKQKESLKTSLKYCKSKESKGRIITTIDLFNTNHKMAYPKSGRAIGLLHAYFENKNKGKECISFGINNGMITVRATDNSTMDVNVLISELKKKFPYAKVDGGGHAHAGSIRFINAANDEIINYIESKY